ncbi:MAG: CPBP family intramembrane metalloprotease [Clostridia bacterium]|nr:CPBP family intramembrane metalloprotease [Clostridia bacterium]
MIPINNPQYPYGQYPYGQEPNGFYPYGAQSAPPGEEERLRRETAKEKRRVRALSSGAALATGGFLLLANVLYVPYMFFITKNVLHPQTEAELILNISVDLLITLVSLFVPFFVVNLLFKKNLQVEPIRYGRADTGAADTLLFIVGGFGMMMIADYIAGNVSAFIQDASGVEFAYDFFETPTSALGVTVYIIRSTLFPAIVEEYAMRGVVMHSLRRYGDGFAITMSAMMFGLMHGNLVQAPFAFLAGLVLGYVVIRTGTLWTGVAIHFLNNSLSIVYSLLYDNGHEKAGELLSLLGTAVGAGVGVLCLVILLVRRKITRPAKNRSVLPAKSLYGAFFLTPPMILVLIGMVVMTVLFQKNGSV